MRKIFLLASILFSPSLFAQQRPGGAQGGFTAMNAGHIYGKVVDASNNKGIDGASLLLRGNRWDSVTKKMIPYTLRAAITQPNGDFDFDQLPVMGNLILTVSNIGYKETEQIISFGFGGGRGNRQGGNQQQSTGGDQASAMQNVMNMVDRDLGNIKLQPDPSNLGTVTVTATRQLFEMGVDRKVFNVDRNILSQGQTATEVMKQIPSISVDIDGNVTMRNATPQIFIDGRPTTLTLDQIPADIIDKVELITNPSARFDASGGNAGILNIVLKKNKRTGYNGGVRFGIDSRGRFNTGGDINLRQGKINFFLSGMYNQRLSKSTSFTERQNFDDSLNHLIQNNSGENKGTMGFIRGGIDLLIDNRNSFTLASNFNKGTFRNMEDMIFDSANKFRPVSNNYRTSNTLAEFKNVGVQLGYKHNFTKAGHEWTADANYNNSKNENTGDFVTQTFNPGTTTSKYPNFIQRSSGSGKTDFLVLQTDYDNPITDKKKLELGARVQIRNFENHNTQSIFNHNTGIFVNLNAISSNYKFTDQVYAGYITYGFKVNTWSYQLGLRAESSDYKGTLITPSGKDSTFNVKFPISLFPSAFITKKLSDKEDIQLNYSRRINRPNFFQLMPFIDFSDPQNLNVGNAGLKPEFTNSFEISYNNNYKKGSNFLASVFAKYNTDLITRYQYKAPSPLEPSDSVIFNTYANANKSFTYGIELTNRINLLKIWDMTVNLNIFNSQIKGTIQGQNLDQKLTSWFVKWNNSFKLPKNFTIQLSGDYYAKTVLPQEGGRGGNRGGQGGGGMMFGGGTQVTAQGYIKPRYSFDIGIRKEWTLKGGNTLSANLNMNDFLKTQKYGTHSESSFFTQETERRRDAQILRLNLQWRFGKFDVNLFKRKNNRQEDGDTPIMTGM
jgi:outer membrane receptor protein involved in Fe transport